MADKRIRRRPLPHLRSFVGGELPSRILRFHLAAKISKLCLRSARRSRAEDLSTLNCNDVESVRGFAQVEIAGDE